MDSDRFSAKTDSFARQDELSGQPFSAMEALRFGMARFNEDAGYCFSYLGFLEGACLVSAAMLGLMWVLGSQLLFQVEAPPESLPVAFILAYLLVRTAAQALINRWLLAVSEGNHMTFADLFSTDLSLQIPIMLRLIAASLVFTFYACLGTLFLVIPGIFASATLRFYRFLIVERDADAVEGLRESYQIAGANKGQLINLNVLTSLIKIAGFCALGVGIIPASAICGFAEAYAYRQLLQEHEQGLAAGAADLN